jgi:hypothetical protein
VGGTTSNLLAMGGGGPGDVYAVGQGGSMFRFDGAVWSQESVPTINQLSGVATTGTGTAIAVGSWGTALARSGGAWSTMKGGVANNLSRIWCLGDGSAIAVGSNGTILSNRTGEWLPDDSGTSSDLRGIHGIDANTIYAVGRGGTALYFDGAAWNPVATGTSEDLNAVWMVAENDVYAAGALGTILHYDGGAWTPQPSNTVAPFYAIWASGPDFVLVAGFDEARRFNGTSWKAEFISVQQFIYHDLWGFASDDVYVAAEGGIFPAPSGAVPDRGHGGGWIYHYNGSAWNEVYSDAAQDIWAGWGESPSRMWGGGFAGSVIEYRDGAWSPVWDLGDRISSAQLTSIDGTSARNVYVVGDRGTILHLR